MTRIQKVIPQLGRGTTKDLGRPLAGTNREKGNGVVFWVECCCL